VPRNGLAREVFFYRGVARERKIREEGGKTTAGGGDGPKTTYERKGLMRQKNNKG